MPGKAMLSSAGKDTSKDWHSHSAVKMIEFELFRGNKILEAKTFH